jgi:hypothetical protein
LGKSIQVGHGCGHHAMGFVITERTRGWPAKPSISIFGAGECSGGGNREEWGPPPRGRKRTLPGLLSFTEASEHAALAQTP